MNGYAKVSTLVLLGLISACGGAQREDAGQTTVTSGTYAPGAVELYTARRSEGPACGPTAPSSIQFAPQTDALLAGEGERLAAWAECLNRPNLAHTTVVLLGGSEPEGGEGLFVARASRIREGLVARGVAPERVVIGAPSAAREGGNLGSTSAVRLEVTTSDTLRAMRKPPPPPVTGGVGFGLR
jgi:hypothetical protein